MAGLPVFAPQMLRKDVRGEFIEAEMVERLFLYQQICTIMPSTSDRENYAYLGSPASMEEHMGTMPISPLTDTGLTPATGASGPGYEIVNKTWAGALIFKRDDMADAKVNGYNQRIQDQAAAAYGFPDERLIAKVVAGTTDVCYLQVGATAEAFFSATHAARGKQTATWSNLLTGSGTDVANLSTDLGSALKAIYTMTNEANRMMNRHCKMIYVMYPQALEVKMRTAVLAPLISSTSNVGFAPNILLLPEPMLDATSADDWYVGTLDGGMRGLIWQEREGVMLEEVGEGSEMWTNDRQIEYAVTRRGDAGYGFPQRLIKINN